MGTENGEGVREEGNMEKERKGKLRSNGLGRARLLPVVRRVLLSVNITMHYNIISEYALVPLRKLRARLSS